MKSKKIALLMAFLIAVSSTMAACSKDGDSSSSKSSSKSSSSGAATTTVAGASGGEREMEGNMYVSGLPIVKEKESFSLFCDDNGKAEDKILYPILEEQTNVSVELMLYPNEIAKEKKNILINSGDYPDAIGGWILSQTDILKDGMVDGLYIPIDEYIEKYAPMMKTMLDIPGVRQTMTLPDGHIYTIPYVLGAPLVPFLPWINGEWLEKIGKEMPTTPDELYEVLKLFKTEDPNGNGKEDEIPYTADRNNMNFGLLAGWWGTSVPTGTDTNFGFAMVDGKLEFTATSDGFREMLRFFKKIYAEGLMDPEVFTQDLSQWKAKGAQNLYGCSMAYGSGDFQQLPIDVTTKYLPLPVLKGVDKPIYRRGSYGTDVLKTQLAFTDKAKNPAVMVRWYDNVFDIDNSVQANAGIFGIRCEKLGDGDYRFLDEALLSEADREKYGWGNMFTQSLPRYVPADIKVKDPVGVPVKYDEKKAGDELYEAFLDELPAKVWMAQEDSKKVATLQTDINKYVEEKLATWISGQADLEAEWDGYVTQLDKLGLQELIQIRQKAQDAAPKV